MKCFISPFLCRFQQIVDRSEGVLDVSYDCSVVVESAVNATTDTGSFLFGKDGCNELGEVRMAGGLCDDAEIAQGMVEMMPSPAVVAANDRVVLLLDGEVAANIGADSVQNLQEQCRGLCVGTDFVRYECR